MANSILTNRISTSALVDASRAETAKAKSAKMLSTGKKINESGQDATGLAVVAKQRYDQAAMVEGLNNSTKGEAYARTVDGGLATVSELLNRLVSLGTAAAADSYDSDDRTIAGVEWDSILTALDKIGASTRFGRQSLLNGTATAAKFQVGESPTGTDDIAEIDLSTVNVLNANLGIPAGSTLDTVDNARTTTDSVRTAVGLVNNYRATVGAFQREIQLAASNNETKLENLGVAIGVTIDADIAKASIDYTREITMQQMARAILAQGNSSMGELSQLIQ